LSHLIALLLCLNISTFESDGHGKRFVLSNTPQTILSRLDISPETFKSAILVVPCYGREFSKSFAHW
jgi:hypothetical protein